MPELFNLVVVPEESGQYLYFFCPPGRAPVSGGKIPSDDVRKMRGSLERKYYRWLHEATIGTLYDSGGSGAPPQLLNLRGLGHQLYKDVVPSELRAAVRSMGEGDLLHVFADNSDIPWELVKDGDDFWGKLYAISNSRWTGGARVEPELHSLPVRRILNVVGYGIDAEAAERAKNLFEHYKKRADVQLIDGGSDENAATKFFQLLPGADLIHFTGHGEMDDDTIYLRIISRVGGMANFMVTSIDSTLSRGCVVFANACRSTKTVTPIIQSLGFGPRFCENGAGAFIGTLDLVPANEAVLFAEIFYDRLFSAHFEIGKALWAARREPLNIGGTMSLVPLLYSLYGNPRATLELLAILRA